MSSKLTFRARTLDASKPMSIYHVEDLPELADLNAINRSVPAMPSGMEKEEEAEKHLQDILEVQEQSYTAMKKPSQGPELVIPTPEVYVNSDFEGYRTLYKGHYKPPRQYIHVQPFNVDQDQPDYDLDEEDDTFLQNTLRDEKKFEVTEFTFEDMLDRLEKNSGRSVVSPQEAKRLLKEDDDLILAVYDYWVDKRLRLKMPLIPTVKSDKRDSSGAVIGGGGGGQASGGNAASGGANASASSSPYIAFRRRTEKMQTRKNRKNDEASYEKMLKLQRDLSRAVTLLEMVKRREKTKKENINLTVDIFEKRYQIQDYDGKMLSELLAARAAPAQLRTHPYNNKHMENWSSHNMQQQQQRANAAALDKRQKRPYKKKRPKGPTSASGTSQPPFRGSSSNIPGRSNGPEFGTLQSSDDESSLATAAPSDAEEEEFEGPYAFKRKRHCQYLAPRLDQHGFEQHHAWPWEAPQAGEGGGDQRFRYSLASLSTPRARCVGMVRRRVGRGGRVILDRAFADHDSLWQSLDFTVLNGCGRGINGGTSSTGVTPSTPSTSFAEEQTSPEDARARVAPFEDWPHFRPVTPPPAKEEEELNPIQGQQLPAAPNLPTQPLKTLLPTAPASSPSVMAAVAAARARGGGGGGNALNGNMMRTVSVDSVLAQNAVAAVVSNDMMDIFSGQK